MAEQGFPVVLHNGQSSSLPFRALVMAPLQAPNQIQALRDPLLISSDNFNQILRELRPTIDVLTIDKTLLRILKCDADALSLTFVIEHYDDFEPHRVLESQPSLTVLLSLMENIHLALQEDSEIYHGSQFNVDGLALALLEQVDITRESLELLVCELEHTLSNLLDTVLHAREWQVIEAAWRGVYWLCQLKGMSEHIDVMILPATRELIWDDLKHASSLDESELYQLIYTESMGQFGGTPYGCVVLDDYFSSHVKDISVLSPLLSICALAQAPLMTGASPEMFSVAQYSHLQDHYSIPELFSTARYLKWRNFSTISEANYLCLTMPRLRFRERYSRQRGQLTWYSETIGNDADQCLWGNAAFAMAANVVRRFMQSGFCTFISGDEGGLVDLLPLGIPSERLPVELNISEDKEAQLISLGFNPVITRPFQRIMLFPSANTLSWGSKTMNRGGTAIDVANAQLHYLFIITRIIHCLKIVFRESLGATASREEISQRLNHWLKQYVSDVESPSLSVLEKRPLRSGKVIVTGSSEHETFDIEVELQPHLKFMGNSVALNTEMTASAETA